MASRSTRVCVTPYNHVAADEGEVSTVVKEGVRVAARGGCVSTMTDACWLEAALRVRATTG